MIIKRTEVASTERQAKENVLFLICGLYRGTNTKPVLGYTMVNLAQVKWSPNLSTYIMSAVETRH